MVEGHPCILLPVIILLTTGLLLEILVSLQAAVGCMLHVKSFPGPAKLGVDG